jgi:hypothetical protein
MDCLTLEMRVHSFRMSTIHHLAWHNIPKALYLQQHYCKNLKFCITHVIKYRLFIKIMGQDSSVGIATCYGLETLGIKSQWGQEFPHTSRPALRPKQPPIQWVPGVSQG